MVIPRKTPHALPRRLGLAAAPARQPGDAASAGTYFGGWTGPVSPISRPDNLAFDSGGNLWISTDGQPSAGPRPMVVQVTRA